MFKSNRQCTERRVQRLTSLPLTVQVADLERGYYLLKCNPHGSEVLALRRTLRDILIKAEELELNKRISALPSVRVYEWQTEADLIQHQYGTRYVFESTQEELGLSTERLASLGFEIWVDRYGNRHGKLSLPHFLPPK